MRRVALIALLVLLTAPLQAQGVAEVARREREKRAAERTAATPVKVLDAKTSGAAPHTSAAPPLRPDDNPKTDTGRAAAATVIHATTPADFGAEQDDVFAFYDIHGRTALELRDEIARLGPVSEGERHQALTQWRITWATTTSSGGDRCRLESVRISSGIEILLPRWVDEVGAPQALAEVWRNYMRGLLAHEHLHKRIALAGVSEIDTIPKSGSDKATCEEAIAPFNAAGKAIVDKTIAKQQDLDRETDHGRKQGVQIR